ncbi:deoxynucleotidyltransferase terminal-interacting protein 1-like isoform X1 [Planococcus citri]|uniref:deoxynucleotidyltransferase terminal-interacting protein 1-like isoform X1 n=1 Tax=Planococcus citri TaxID=170843 RepID=UPI0031F8CB0C
MVVNKLQRGFSWDSYTRFVNSNNNILNNNSGNNARFPANESVTINEPLVEWKNTFHMRQATLENLADMGVNENGGKNAVKAAKMRGRNVVNAAKSLDLLRQNIQSAINNDIDRVIKKYLDMYFVPAISNIRGNLGQGSVNEEHVRELCRTMLDEAKHLYLNSPLSRSDSPFNAAVDTGALIESRFGNSQDDNDDNKRLFTFGKRKESDSSSSANSTQLLLSHSKRKSIISTTSCLFKNDPSRITSKTLFIMSSRVNKVLGYGAMRGKLFVKHPDLFRYSVDLEDKDWLIRHKLHYTSHSSSGSSYILILDDIRELLNLECYRNNPSVLRHELKGFEAPEFMLKKMRFAITHGKSVRNLETIHQLNLSSPGNTSMALPSSSFNSSISENHSLMDQDPSQDVASGVIQPTNVLIQVKEKKKVPKSNWTEDAMQKALRLISRGRSQRYVERKFGIPRRTLRNRLKIAATSRKNF